MGATLGHLIIHIFNTSQYEVVTMSTSIDFAASVPISKAESVANPEELFKAFPKWNKTDTIVYVISIPLIMKPAAFVPKYENLTKLDIDPAYDCSATVMDNEGRIFQDQNYDPVTEPYITAISVNGKEYKHNLFKMQ